jgi:hypothetical protein
MIGRRATSVRQTPVGVVSTITQYTRLHPEAPSEVTALYNYLMK